MPKPIFVLVKRYQDEYEVDFQIKMGYYNHLFLTMVFHNACDEGELSTPKGNVTFAVANLQNNSKAGRSLETLTPAFLLVDIDDENGNKLFVNQIMSLHAFGETYITENLKLNKGNYKTIKVFST
jgi:hypothetical protein